MHQQQECHELPSRQSCGGGCVMDTFSICTNRTGEFQLQRLLKVSNFHLYACKFTRFGVRILLPLQKKRYKYKEPRIEIISYTQWACHDEQLCGWSAEERGILSSQYTWAFAAASKKRWKTKSPKFQKIHLEWIFPPCPFFKSQCCIIRETTTFPLSPSSTTNCWCPSKPSPPPPLPPAPTNASAHHGGCVASIVRLRALVAATPRWRAIAGDARGWGSPSSFPYWSHCSMRATSAAAAVLMTSEHCLQIITRWQRMEIIQTICKFLTSIIKG